MILQLKIVLDTVFANFSKYIVDEFHKNEEKMC